MRFADSLWGLSRLLIDKKFRVPLDDLLRAAYESGTKITKRLTFEETKAAILDFIATRFKFSMLEENHNQDYVESVLPCVARDIYDGYERLIALETQKSKEDFDRLMVGFRRVYNITKQITGDPACGLPDCLFSSKKRTFSVFMKQSMQSFSSSWRNAKYADSLSVLVSFKETIDNYFDKVFVMDNDEAMKNNRLAVLTKIKNMFLTFADFSKIRIE